MASDNLINVIPGLVKRDGRMAKEADQKAKAKLKAEKEKDEARSRISCTGCCYHQERT